MPELIDRIWGIVGSPLTRRRQVEVRSFAHLIHNILESAISVRSYITNRRKIAEITSKLQTLIPAEGAGGQIPRIIHFVYGFKRAEHFPYYGLMAIKSAAYHNPGWRLVFHYQNEPYGEYWDAAKHMLILNQMPDFQRFGIARIIHYAHKADVVRLLALKHIGGAYLDIDTLTVKSFEDLRQNPFVMAVQAEHNGARGGLCNAAMLGAPGARFVLRWLRQYRCFHSKGRDYLWDFHSVKLPAMLSCKDPNEIRILDHNTFFYPLWTDVDRILLSEDSARWLKHLQSSYLFHLWNNLAEDTLLRIDKEFIVNSKSAYAEFARPLIEER